MRTLLFLAACCIATFPFASDAGVSAVHIKLRSEVQLPGPFFSLGDIATVSGSTSLIDKRLADTRIGVVPPIGYPLTVSAAKVSDVLKSHGVTGHYRLKWGGASSVVVYCLAKRYGAAAPLAGARRALTKYLADHVPDAMAIRVTPTGDFASIDLPAGKVTATSRLSASAHLSKRMVVWVDISVNSRRYRSIPIWFDVTVTKPVLVTSVDVPARHNLDSSDVRTEVRDVAGLLGSPLATDSKLDQLRARQTIGADAVVLREAVERKPLVDRLQPVLVRVSVGTVRISTRAVAESEGRAGDLVRVRNPNSHQTYIARVIGPGTVSVSAR